MLYFQNFSTQLSFHTEGFDKRVFPSRKEYPKIIKIEKQARAIFTKFIALCLNFFGKFDHLARLEACSPATPFYAPQNYKWKSKNYL